MNIFTVGLIISVVRTRRITEKICVFVYNHTTIKNSQGSMTATEGSLLLQSSIALAISNLDSSRARSVSLEKRRVGWTEEWGKYNFDTGCQAGNSHDQESQVLLPYPQLPVTLFQYRPAWFEQLVLHLAKIPHIVVNSPYPATEATGPLPCLREKCVLVGRQNPVAEESSNNHFNDILEYLRTREGWSVDGELKGDISLQNRAHLFQSLVLHQLTPALHVLRFLDPDAWQQVYRPQYVQASRGGSLLPFGAWFHAWSQRVVASKMLSRTWTIGKAKTVVKEAYAVLDLELKTTSTYLLGTVQPTTVDALLWAHISEALCDVHLVTILADYPHLVKFFQSIYQTYFRVISDEDWRTWNMRQNTSNPFQHIPLEPQELATSTYHNAFELMQSLSIHQHDLQESLILTRETRASEIKPTPKRKYTFHRWRLGDDLSSSSPNEESPAHKKWREEHKSHDELWISCVLGITALAIIFGSRGS
jgi:hypothetical protein